MKLLKNTLILTAVTLVGSAFVIPAYAGHDHGQEKVQMKQGNLEAMGEGVVHSIDMNLRIINLSHGPIPALKWPAMKMDLEVARSVNLTELQPGQNIKFHIKLGEDKRYRITKVMVAGAENHSMRKQMNHGDAHEQGHDNHKH
ncbi:MAG: Cu/Ag efflux protein CusF [Parvibaculaceae bacterium]|jgi:Cu/Ag efflux protein CusF|uniref:copper-binding protein n=1 Tax=Kordiimonas sp. TaxID=1970157 RepID=UPI003AD1D954